MGLIPIYTWTKGVRNFDHRRKVFAKQPWAQGVVLLTCVIVAMLLANLPATKDFYHNLLETNISLFCQSPDGNGIFFPRGMTVESFINDILMTVFFFTVGLEIRREMKVGELSSVKKAMLPVIAAFGGVVAPALIFFTINHGTAAATGWGIPTATDIAFAVGILSILGDRVPVSLKVFLTALAIADDLIAILVVALFYGGQINFILLGIAVLVRTENEQVGRETRSLLYVLCGYRLEFVLLCRHPLYHVRCGNGFSCSYGATLSACLLQQKGASVHPSYR